MLIALEDTLPADVVRGVVSAVRDDLAGQVPAEAVPELLN